MNWRTQCVRVLYPIAGFLFFLTFLGYVHAAELPKVTPLDAVELNERAIAGAVPQDTALIDATDRQLGAWPDVFCEALTSEQIGFAIDTLAAQLLDGVPINSQADSFIAKLQAAQNRLTPKNIAAVFDRLEDFIVRVDTLSRSGKLTLDQGDLLINSILGVVCRT